MQRLPTDIIRLLALKLDAIDLAHFFIVCKRHASISKDPKFWQKKLKLDFCILHGNLKPPFTRPSTVNLSEKKQLKYRNKIKEVARQASQACPYPRKYKHNLEIDNLSVVLDNLCKWLDSQWRFSTDLSPYTDQSADPRRCYLRLYQYRCRVIGDNYDHDLKMDPEYMRLKESMKALKQSYHKRGRSFTKTAKAVGKYLIPKFEPAYHRLTLTESVADNIIYSTYKTFATKVKAITNIQVTHGTLIDIVTPHKSHRILVYVDTDGDIVRDCYNVNETPHRLIKLARENDLDEKKVKEMYLPCDLDFSGYFHNEEDSESEGSDEGSEESENSDDCKDSEDSDD